LGPGSGLRLSSALLALDTPSLRGLFASAPYLHDGSAATMITRLSDGIFAEGFEITGGIEVR
jgi:hypothetical protein